MIKILDEFNTFFEGNVKVVITDNILAITIGAKTLTIKLPGAIGW